MLKHICDKLQDYIYMYFKGIFIPLTTIQFPFLENAFIFSSCTVSPCRRMFVVCGGSFDDVYRLLIRELPLTLILELTDVVLSDVPGETNCCSLI